METPRGVSVLYRIMRPKGESPEEVETTSFYQALEILLEDDRIKLSLENYAISIKETGFDEFEFEDLAAEMGFEVAESIGYTIQTSLIDPYEYAERMSNC